MRHAQAAGGGPIPAGWSFVPQPVLDSVVVPGVFAVEIEVGGGGFQVDGHLTPPARVTESIQELLGGYRPPVLVVPHGLVPAGPAADLLYTSLAAGLGTPVIASDGPVGVSPDGTLETAGTFREWRPGAGASPDEPSTTAVGSLVAVRSPAEPPPPVALARAAAHPAAVQAPASPPARSRAGTRRRSITRGKETVLISPPAGSVTAAASPTPVYDHRDLDWSRWRDRDTATTAITASALIGEPAATTSPAGAGAPAQPPAPAQPHPPAAPRTAIGPVWIDAMPRPVSAVDIRRAVRDRFDAYSRIVARTLAEQPGLSAGGAAPELTAELIALCAYHRVQRDQVNDGLRTGSAGESELNLARAAARGLRRLPVVLGPVFAAAPVVAEYRPGDELVEPAFIDVDLARSAVPSAGVELAIWSTSARRLGSFDDAGAAIAVFPPASRFLVLGVQRPDRGGVRVLLRDRADGRPLEDAIAQRLLDRMSAAIAVPAGPGAGRVLTFAPGVDGHGRHFLPPGAASDWTPSAGERS